MPANQAE